ncbi:MAG: cell division regulator GpsB [Bacilli bacterium]|nr:cell division regulator GpsB [Bacilli bacterium]
MMNDKLFLTPQEILEKDFKIDARGYRMPEVDKFLDMIIRDYTEFMRVIKKLENDNIHLINDNKKLQAEYRNLKENILANEDDKAKIGNVDLLKRISNLEKIVYGRE